ncbi:DUF1772-domain-containing protein [Lojkania enalia]|uniref:DUF1772-domain-containing protein n=1 Tax=Lojkania enalia TaxID=147567 RepID=A0A9P4N7R3_9PLEO|nr:DUF1772-domain-containing protein [Didymosphaeria enalia]
MASGLLSEKPPLGLLVAQAVGITTSTFLFGANTNITINFIPAILKAPAGLAAQQWQIVYYRGIAIGPALSVVSALATAWVAYHQDSSSLAFKLNTAAAIILPSIIPYTFAFLAPINKKLHEAANSATAAEVQDQAAKVGITNEKSVHQLIDKWGTLHLVRAAITGVGAVLAIWAAIDKMEGVGYTGVALASGANRMG